MEEGGCPPEQSSSQHEAAFPTCRGNNLIRHGLVAPDKNMPFFDHSPEKILVFSCQKLRSKRLCVSRENALFQQHVSGPSLPPVDNESRRVGRPFVELALNDPLWRLLVEVRLHWSEHTIHIIFVASLEQGQQPALVGNSSSSMKAIKSPFAFSMAL